MKTPRLISFYLPQYYPTKENDEWWAKGFTEWTNVGNAKPLFKGHYQPRVPADLGYYDLRIPEVREMQAELAKEAGIEGFCYWHYWFAGRRLLDRVFAEVVEFGKPDFPFCLCWANHSWYQKTWDPSKPDKLLIEQTYPGETDIINHFYAMLSAFKDERYMKVDGKLIFGIYSPLTFPDFQKFKDLWNKLAIENGLKGFYFFAFTFRAENLNKHLEDGFDSVVYDGVMVSKNRLKGVKKIYFDILRNLFHKPRVLSYAKYAEHMEEISYSNRVHPSIDPNFDHSPRSSYRGVIIKDSTPEKWGKLCKKIFQKCIDRRNDSNLIFIKAWNEWGEGNYLEPDLRYGKRYINEIRNALNDLSINM